MAEVVELHPHAKDRLSERGATEVEVILTVRTGETFPAKFSRTGFRRNFNFDATWKGKIYSTKQVEAYCVKERKGWLVITVLTKFF